MKLFRSLQLLLLIFTTTNAFSANPKAPFYLRTCDNNKPVGTDERPYFGWYINDSDNNEMQTAYQVIVASTSQLLNANQGDVWDSGKTGSRSQNFVYFDGKSLAAGARYFWKVRTWDKDGNVSPYSASASFDTGLFKSKDWEGAKWIKRDTRDEDDYTYFRKKLITPKKNVRRAIAYISAFHNYDLYLNGGLVGKGLAHHYPQYAYYNAWDISKLIKRGSENTFAALTHWYGGGQGRAKGDRGFLLKVVVEFADGSRTILGTDKTWKQKQVEAFITNQPRRNGEGVGYIDRIDSRKIESDWNKADYDDSSWQGSVEIGAPPVAPFSGDLQADLTRLKEEVIKPVSVKKLSDGSFIIDLGKVYAGMPKINFEGGKAGDIVSMKGGFVLNKEGAVNTRLNQGTNLDYYFILNGTKAVFQPFVYLGYRYLQVENCPNELSPDNVRFISRHFELDPARAQFSSSNTTLNQVWDLMIHSLSLGAQEGFVDTPTREKGEFLGDAWSQGVPAMTTMGERNLNHRVLLEFLDSQDQYWPDGRLNAVYPNVDGKRDIPDYTQFYLIWAWDYYLHTGNKEFLRSNYEKLKKVADYVDRYRNKSTGLIHNLEGGSGPYKYGIIDWPADMRYGYDMLTEARTVINAYAYLDFDIMSKIADVAANQEDISVYREKAEGIKNAMNGKLINNDGLYIDGLRQNGSQSNHVSQHANMFPLALGIVPEANKGAVTRLIRDRKMNVGMVTVRYLPEAIGEAGEGEHLLELYTNPTWDGWAQTLKRGGTATWESWSAMETRQSMSHPWGAVGLLGIQQYVLGVKVLTPQAHLLQIKPLDFKGKLGSAKGVYTTDKGEVRVDWKRSASLFSLNLNIPVNVFSRVYVPAAESAAASLKVDGKELPAKRENDYLLIENLGSGKHKIELSLK